MTGENCLLGLGGSYAKNYDATCELHGRFDVWVTQNDELLISDMGFPSAEPKQCLALGVNLGLARRVAREKSQQLGTKVITTQRRCFQCASFFWFSEHRASSGLVEIGQGYLCPRCMRERIDETVKKKLGVMRYWCG